MNDYMDEEEVDDDFLHGEEEEDRLFTNDDEDEEQPEKMTAEAFQHMFTSQRDVDPVHSTYYALLNVSPTATQEEIKAAYRRLVLVWHPDKHQHDLCEADRAQFDKIQTAYLVLSDAEKRAIYDAVGPTGLQAEERDAPVELKTVGPLLRSKAEIREALYRQKYKQSKQALRAAQSVVRSQARIAFDVSDLVEARAIWPTFASLRLVQKAKLQPTPRDRIEVTGTISGQKELAGQTGLHWSHSWSQRTSGAVQAQGTPGRFSYALSLFRAVTSKEYPTLFSPIAYLTASVAAAYPRQSNPVLSQSYTRLLSKDGSQQCSIALNVPLNVIPSAMRIPISVRSVLTGKVTEYCTAQTALTVDAEGQAGIEVATKVPLDANGWTELKTECVLGGGEDLAVLECHLACTLGKRSSIGLGWQCGIVTGLYFKIKCVCFGMSFSIPLLLQRSASLATSLGTIAGSMAVVGASLYSLYFPYQRRRRIKQNRKLQERYATVLYMAKEAALAAQKHLLPTATAKLALEETKNGLVITKATYGDASIHIDVTVPVQTLVEQSTLAIAGGFSKRKLVGFYDPNLGADKVLRVEYLFRGAKHVATVGDEEALQCPSRAHMQ